MAAAAAEQAGALLANRQSTSHGAHRTVETSHACDARPALSAARARRISPARPRAGHRVHLAVHIAPLLTLRRAGPR